MEKFKAVEKEMKTKAYSKEGLQAAAKLDPKEQEKADTSDFLARMVEELERQIEQAEAEIDNLQIGLKKKKDNQRAERVADQERRMDGHKAFISKLELVLRALENDSIDVPAVKDLEDSIRYYVDNNTEPDFMEDEGLFDDLSLDEEEDMFGMNNDMDRVSSQDTQSLAEDMDVEARQPGPSGKPKSSSMSESSSAAARRPSQQLKSPLPALATLNHPLPTTTNGTSSSVKPAPPPARIPGEPLKYASAAAAAAASDKSGLGLPVLPPPIAASVTQSHTGLSPVPAAAVARAVPAASPATVHSQPSSVASPKVSKAPPATVTAPSVSVPAAPDRPEPKKPEPVEEEEEEEAKKIEAEKTAEETATPSTPALTNGDTHSEVEEEESIYHLPSSLSDLLESFEATKASAFQPLTNPAAQRLFIASQNNYPETADSDRPQHYRPQNPYPYTPNHYPSEPSPVFNDQRLYGRCDTDTLFFSFYYKQGSYQQYAAAKALKNGSWRFHKQYQTWFQRHEEPKSITEDYEQGTYRFFDYESTW
jgi:CCR4-NOT transcription complex subunit 3